MKVRILNPQSTIFSAEAESVFIKGDTGEFEILDFHAPIISLLRKGEVTIDWERKFPVSKGIVKFYENECLILLD